MPSPNYRRELPTRFRLEASRCKNCEKVSYPKRPICPWCRDRESETIHLAHEGTVITSTVIHVPPPDLTMEAPYAMALIETPEKARLMVQVVDCEPSSVTPGMNVALEFRRIRREGLSGVLCYGYKAVPVG